MDHDHDFDSDLVPDQVSAEEMIDQNNIKPRGFFLKFKIPKTSFDGEDRADHLDGSDHREGGHVCHFCGKKFSCGKALGGHVRVHMIKTGRGKKMVARPKQLPVEDWEEEEAGERREVVKVSTNTAVKCCLCSKEFRSMKSLFGHMRNHPERGWRGIRPPEGEVNNNNNNNNNSCSSSSTVSENEQLMMSSDLVRALPKGPEVVRKKRRIETVSDEVSQAAYILMRLAYSGQSLDLGKLVRNPSFVYEEEEGKLGQFKGEVIKEKNKKRKMGSRMLKLDFDLNQPYVAPDGEGTIFGS